MNIKKLLSIGVGIMTAGIMATAAEEAVFEKLIVPQKTMPVPTMRYVEKTSDGGELIWDVRDFMSKCYLVAVDPKTAKTRCENLAEFGFNPLSSPRAKMFRMPNKGGLYAHVTSYEGGAYMKYNNKEAKWEVLGTSSPKANYQIGPVGFSEDGILYVGTFPRAEIIPLDTKTDTILKPMLFPTDPKMQYVMSICCAANGTIFAVLGLHHTELWSMNYFKGEMKQLLPEELLKSGTKVTLCRGTDGFVYANVNNDKYRCLPDKLEKIDKIPATITYGAHEAISDGRIPMGINNDNQLLLKNPKTKQIETIQTDLVPLYNRIYSVAKRDDGKIYGGTLNSCCYFQYDPIKNTFEDYGRVTSGTIQVYDSIQFNNGMLIGSYTGGNLDFFCPETKEKKHIAALYKEYDQERVYKLIYGKNGYVYGCTVPTKGHLGGSVFEVKPSDSSIRVWKDPIPKQSCLSITPAHGNLLFVCCSINGGSSAIPEEKEAVVMLFNPETGKVEWSGKPVPEETDYNQAVSLPNDKVCFLSIKKAKYVVFDTAKRKVLKVGNLPKINGGKGALFARYTTKNGFAIGHYGNTLFAINPNNYQLTVLGNNDSLSGTLHNMELTDDDTLYYMDIDTLWRAKLPKLK